MNVQRKSIKENINKAIKSNVNRFYSITFYLALIPFIANAQTVIEIAATPIVSGPWDANYDGLLGFQIHRNIPFAKSIPVHLIASFHSQAGQSDAQNLIFSFGAQHSIPITNKFELELNTQMFYWREELAISYSNDIRRWNNAGLGIMGEISVKRSISNKTYLNIVAKQFFTMGTTLGLKLSYIIPKA